MAVELTPKQLGVVSMGPRTPISGLMDYIGYLDANKRDAGRYKLEMWRKLLSPLSRGGHDTARLLLHLRSAALR